MKKTILEYVGIVVGCFVVSVAFALLINPYKLVPGGVYGTSIVLHNLFPSFQIGTISYSISIPLLVLSYFFLGKNIGVKTLVASLLTPLMMNIITSMAYPTQEAIESLDPALLCGGSINLSHDLIIAVTIGPLLYGAATGLLVKCGATTGGSDIVAMFISKYMRVKFSHALMFVDMAVVTFGLVVIGFGIGTGQTAENSWILSGYSLICIFVCSRTVAFVLSGAKDHKLLFIVTDHDKEQMRVFILNELDRTATVLSSHGLYAQQDKATLMMVVKMKEVDAVTTAIATIDPNAFVVVTDAYDTFGYRWNKLPTNDHAVKLG